MWNDPGLRIESEVDGVLILHLFKTLSQISFLSHTIHRWEVIYFLERLKLA